MATIIGTDTGDLLIGTSENDTIRGLGGNDMLRGLDGADLLDGGESYDWLQGGSGNDVLLGGAGDDSLAGELGDDMLDGGDGADTAIYDFRSQVAGVVLNGSATGTTAIVDIGDGLGGTDRLAGIERLSVSGSANGDTLIGGAGADYLSGGAGADMLLGGAGNDQLDGGDGDDRVYGGDGDDWLEGHGGDDRLVGGDGYDRASYFFLGAAAGVLFDASAIGTTALVDIGDGSGGIDQLASIERLVVWGSNHADTLIGGGSDDDFHGGSGNDVLVGGPGSDVLNGGGDYDLLQGGAGDDRLYGEGSDDTLVGGEGVDTAGFSFSAVSEGVIFDGSAVGTAPVVELDDGVGCVDRLESIERLSVAGSPYPDFLIGGAGDDDLAGGRGDDIVEGGPGSDSIHGSDGADALRGGDGTDYLWGEVGRSIEGIVPGNDVLEGGTGADYLWGEEGDDTLEGGPGHDVLDGGPGADVARFVGQASRYLIVPNLTGTGESDFTVFDIDPADGDEGADEVSSIEWLRFVDKDVDLATITLPDNLASVRVAQDSGAVTVIVVANSADGQPDPDPAGLTTLSEVQSLAAPADLPASLQLPIGVIAFEASVSSFGKTESFSLLVDDTVPVDGYWVRDAEGRWVNLASDAVHSGGMTRVDFTITDGGEFDADGLANGVIVGEGGMGAGERPVLDLRNKVLALYIAYFNRAPDAQGLQFWLNAAQSGLSLYDVSAGFANHPRFAQEYGGLTNAQVAEKIYLNVLHRPGDADGIAFWTEQLESRPASEVFVDFAIGALLVDLEGMLARGELTAEEYRVAFERQKISENLMQASEHFLGLFGDATTPTAPAEQVASDPAYQASIAVLKNVDNDLNLVFDQRDELLPLVGQPDAMQLIVDLLG